MQALGGWNGALPRPRDGPRHRTDGARAHRADGTRGLSFRKRVIEDDLGVRGLQKLGEKKWRKAVAFWVKRLTSPLLLDDVVFGGGNARELEHRPPASG